MMSSRSISEFQQVLANPREALDIEIKGWLNLRDANHRADLAKAIIALANSGGGIIVVGLSEDNDGRFTADPSRPENVRVFTQDAVQDAVQRYVDPPVQCRVEFADHPAGLGSFPIVVVEGGHRTPIKAKGGSPDGKLTANRVYIRRPGPKSEEPQSASEWDSLFERAIRARKDELLDGMRDVLSDQVKSPNAQPPISQRLDAFVIEAHQRWAERVENLPIESHARFPFGYYECSFAVDGEFPVLDMATFRDTFRDALKSHSGWPPFIFMTRDIYRPAPIANALEAWIGPTRDGSSQSAAHSDFWRARPDGLFYLRRGYNEDSGYQGMEPGKFFDITTPTWRIGEILLQSSYIATALGASSASIYVRIKWVGLKGRKLVSVGNPNRYLSPDDDVCQESEYSTEKVIAVDKIYDNLPELVWDILTPVYTLFDFWKLPKRLVEEELREMKKHKFY